jgi:hypothetical protein
MKTHARRIVFAFVILAAVAFPSRVNGGQTDHHQPESKAPRIIQLAQRVAVRFSTLTSVTC